MVDQLRGDARFRQDALDSLRDTPAPSSLTVVSPSAWYFLAVCVMASLAALVWAFTYRVPDYVSADGICLVPESVRGITAIADGRVSNFAVERGGRVSTGDLIATTDMQSIEAAIRKAENLLTVTQQANERYQIALDQWLLIALETIEDQTAINTTRLAELNDTVLDSQTLLERQAEQNRVMNDRLQTLFGALTSESKKIVDSMNQAQENTTTTSRDPVFSSQSVAEQTRILAEDERSLLSLRQQRLAFEEDQLDRQTRISELENQKRELEQSNQRLSLDVLERKRTYESEMMERRLDEVRLSLELDALRAQKQREGYIYSPHTGTVLMFHKTIGDTVTAGERIGTLITHTEDETTLQCLAYFPIGSGNRINTGDTALTTPSTHRRIRDGSIRGSVVGVEPYLANEDSLFAQIGNRTMSQRLLEQENLKGVRIALDIEPSTQHSSSTIKYRWTGRTPSDFTTLKPGTTATVRIRIDSRTPVELAFTRFRRWLEPSG